MTRSSPSSPKNEIAVPARGATASPPQRAAGFTLIELLITVAIIAILAAVAMPAYLEQIRKSRRADAITALSHIQQAQERWRANNATYTATLSNLNIASPLPSGYYTLAIITSSATGYIATATAASSQASDTACATLTVTQNGGNITYASTGTGTADRCWNR